jgi:hypothetical protein
MDEPPLNMKALQKRLQTPPARVLDSGLDRTAEAKNKRGSQNRTLGALKHCRQ